MQNLSTALKAVSYLPPSAMWGHAARRLRNILVPRAPGLYRARLRRQADRLPRFCVSEPVLGPCAVTAAFFRAKHAKNAESCLRGKFTFLNKTIDFGGLQTVDWFVEGDEGNHQLWRANLGFMGYLSAAAERDPEAALVAGAVLAEAFMKVADFSDGGQFTELWHPYGTSQRCLALATTLSIVPAALRETENWRALEAFLRFNVAFVMANLETELGLNHLERNLSAIALYVLGAAEIHPRASRLLRRHVPPVIKTSLGADGVQLERSAMYQALTIQSLRIFQALPFWTASEQGQIETALPAAQKALAALTLGDDQPVMFNDAWMGETPPTHQIVPDDPPGFTVLPDGGYVRLTDRDAVVVFDAGPIGVDSNPGHGHADFLAIEASVGEWRLIVDPGTYSYTIGPDGGAIRHASRSWAAHNGPAFLDGRPVEFRGSFKVGRRASARLEEAMIEAGEQSAAGSLSFDDFHVERRLRLATGRLDIEDRWALGTGPRRTRFLIPAEWRLKQSPGRLHLEREGVEVLVSWPAEVGLEVGSAQWSPSYNVMAPAHELLFRPSSNSAQITIAWDRKGRSKPLATETRRSTAAARRLESILAFPKRQAEGSALYNTLLYEAIERLGVPVFDYRRFFRRPPATSLFHFHWPDRVFGGLAKLHESIGALGVRRFRQTLTHYRESGRPVVWTVHNSQPHDFRTARYEQLYKEIAPQLTADVSGYIFLSGYSMDYFLRQYPQVSRDQCSVIPHMITPITAQATMADAPEELSGDNQYVSFYLTPGHIRRYKNIEASLALFDRIKSPGQLFVIAGPPTDAAYVEDLRAKFGGRPDVLILARILREPEMNWCYQNAIAVFSIRAAESNSGVLFSAISNRARVLVNAGPVTDELSSLIGPGWIVEAGEDGRDVQAALKQPPSAPPVIAWGDPIAVARAHLQFMENLVAR